MPPPCTKMIRLRNRELLVTGFDPAASFCIGGSQHEGLASGAEVAATVLYHAPLNVTPANGAGFASPMSNLEIEMGCAQFAFGSDVGIHAGAFAADGPPKYPADVVM